MNREDIEKKLIEILTTHEIEHIFKPSTNIGSKTLSLDSVKFLKVCVDIENAFGIELQYEDAISSNFQTLEGMVQLVVARKNVSND
ncbi:acyl carrier protein [Cytobacillus oceanisediminis]|uniref:acyl carrier protein n=1 Tax=Cytobacillus oceanisediminis TaxID=665099 RepID=UPI001C239D10|nr:hypothetical protein [Cytobacillus oceanisediminis]MBU8772078.1 hypothetical protein [Cytobacillus oceanisediminis]